MTNWIGGRMSRRAVWSHRLARFAVPVLLVTALAHRFALIDTPTALTLLAIIWAGSTVALLLGLSAMRAIWRLGIAGTGRAFAGIVTTLPILAVPLFFAGLLLRTPVLNDVTTDPADPPQFAAADHPLVATLAARMSQLPAAALIYAPLAVGRHADHQITRAAAEMWAGSRLRYYEDYPYVAAPGALAAVIGEAPGWQPTVIPLTPADLDAKYESIWAYTSQISTFFQDRAELEEKVGGYARQVGGERWWRKTG